MYLIQLLLPLRDNEGQPFGREPIDRVRGELTGRFGGVTAYVRAPAEGAWREPEGTLNRDEVIVVEVMTESLERDFWSTYRAELEARFRQDQVLIRALEASLL